MSKERRDHRERQHRHRHGPCLPGVIHRVTQGVGERIGIGRKWVLGAFIVMIIFSFPVALLAFLLAMFWIDHPGRLERLFDRASNWLRRTFSGPSRPAAATAAAGGAGTAHGYDPDNDFAELRARFADLEKRAAGMEEHVTSGDYGLGREIDRMRDGKE